jgi:uncharacterized membrane protein
MTKSKERRTFGSDFRQFFLRGLVVLLPSVLTLWIVVKAYQFVDNTIAEPINKSVRGAMLYSARFWTPLHPIFDPPDEEVETFWNNNLTESQREVTSLGDVRTQLRAANLADTETASAVLKRWWDDHWYLDFIGLVVAIIMVYVAGRLLGGFFGRRMYRKIETIITTFPVFKQVYPHVKQVVDFLFSDERTMQFNRVVVTQYPREGIWSVGFLTGDTMRSIADHSGDSVTVFIPSSPTPFTGYTITVPREGVIELPISVEEAIRFAVSGGVLVPEHQAIQRMIDEATEDHESPRLTEGLEKETDGTGESEARRDAG